MDDRMKAALLELGDRLDATDSVQEKNFIGFNKPDKLIWQMIRNSDDEIALLVTLHKYQVQCAERFPDLFSQIDWTLPEGAKKRQEKAKEECRTRRAAEKATEKKKKKLQEKARLDAEKAAIRNAPAVAKVVATITKLGVALDLVTDKRLGNNQFGIYLSATRKLRGKYDGVRWTVPMTADFETYRKDLAAAQITLEGELPSVSAEELAFERNDVKVFKMEDGFIGISHPFCERMNAAYRNAEETSGIIGWNPEKRCRMVGKDNSDDLREVLAVLNKIHPEWTIGFRFDLESHYKEVDERKAALRRINDTVVAKLREDIIPLPHQIEGYNYLTQYDGNVLVGDDMGLGKTFQVLLWAANHNKRILVVCPKNVRRQWLQECVKFFKDGTFRGLELDTKLGAELDLSQYNIVSINYEILAKYEALILESGFDALVIDESHRMKNPNAKITQTLQRIAPAFQHKILLSGTPIKNKKKEIFTQANLVRPGTFKDMQEVAWMTTFQAREVIKTFFFRRTKMQELKNLPPKLRSIVNVNGHGLPDYVKGMEIGDISRLRSQLAQAKVPMTIDFVEEILGGSDSKVIVFTESDDAAEKIAEYFGERAVLHTGSTSHEQREKRKAAFNDKNNETVRVFVATTPSCREGVNLTIADKVVFNDLPYTPADINQAEDRTWRIGQTAPFVNVYWICAANNKFDSKIISILVRKMEIYKKIIDGKKPTEEDSKFLKTPIDRQINEEIN